MLRLAALAIILGTSVPALAHGPKVLPPGVTVPPRAPGALSRLRNQVEIAKGRKLFENETFGGNGRTCATCHAAKEGFALSPADVARRPASDPLFVFERVPALATLENGEALRTRALITENVDGFKNPGVLRSVPHTVSLSQSINPQSGYPKVHALGWGGDGSALDGALRNFAVGAVIQHFPKTLNRTPGVDFRLPTDRELDAMEAFQLSLGRQAPPPNVDPHVDGFLVFHDAKARLGQNLFAGMPSRQGGTRSCSECHTNGGALNDQGENEQQANGNELTPGAPACFFATAPGDDGFGPAPLRVVDRSEFCVPEDDDDGDPLFPVPPMLSGPVPFRGNQFFSVPPVIESVDVPPFFHDNSVNTIEEVIAFYDSDAFDDSITGAGNGFIIPTEARNQLAAFVRSLNAYENIREAIAAIDTITLPGPDTGKKAMIDNAQRQVGDAIRVLVEGGIYEHTALVSLRLALAELGAKQTAAARADLVVARGLIAS